MRQSQFSVRIHSNHVFEIAFRGPAIKPTRRQHARNVYARALVEQMLDHVHGVLGAHNCSSTISRISGICNNLRHLRYGSAGVAQLRADTERRVTLQDDLPNPRVVSDALCKAEKETSANGNVNFLMVAFGQFLDHDIILTPSGSTPKRDASFTVSEGPRKNRRMSFLCSDILLLPKCCNRDYRLVKPGHSSGSPFNSITAYIDGSGIYGSTPVRSRALRSYKNGKLIMRRRRGQLLPPRNSKRDMLYTLDNANRPNDPHLFATGDVRANENPVLMSLHTLFVREHNRVCDVLRFSLRRKKKPIQTDEWLFQQARRIVIAELQSIVYNEFLPALLGRNPLPPYSRYKKNVDATMTLLFTTAAYRWGHSAIREDLHARDLDGSTKKHLLQDAFFNPKLFETVGIEKWLLGAIHAPAMTVDLQHADSIRDFLFHPERRGVLDLVALNIQRGRDHALPTYLEARRLCDLSVGFDDIPKESRDRILAVYGSGDRVDVFIGGLAEQKVKGSLLGALFHKIVQEQFRRLRDGDRFFYENVEWGEFLNGLDVVKRIRRHEVKLAHIIKSNTRINDSHMSSKDAAMRTES